MPAANDKENVFNNDTIMQKKVDIRNISEDVNNTAAQIDFGINFNINYTNEGKPYDGLLLMNMQST